MYDVAIWDNNACKDVTNLTLTFIPTVGLVIHLRSLELLADVEQVIYQADTRHFRVKCRITSLSGCYSA